MKRTIERMEVFGIEMPLTGSFTSAGITKNVTKCVVIRLTASDGAVGISSIEASANAKSPGTAPELAAVLRDRVATAIVGQDPLNVHRLIELLDKLTPTQPGAGAGVEMACIDLAAHIHGVPMHTYLGGAVEPEVQFNSWIGALPPDKPTTTASQLCVRRLAAA